MKLDLLKEEGVEFDEKGKLIDKSCWWDDFKV
jgi:methylated-DNA-[protein]-cysteine S-methyltransferase